MRRRRTKKEFAIFLKNLANNYPNSETIIFVLDNFNTHTPNSFYEVSDAQTAQNLSQRFEFVYTPKSASGLNMIEIELSALSRQCLNREIPSINPLTKEVMQYLMERMDNKILINWQFCCQTARNILNKHYEKYKITNLNTVLSLCSFFYFILTFYFCSVAGALPTTFEYLRRQGSSLIVQPRANAD